MIFDFRKLEKGTPVEITLRMGKIHYSTVGYFKDLENRKGEKFLVMNKYRNCNDDHFEIISEGKYPLRFIKAYTFYR